MPLQDTAELPLKHPPAVVALHWLSLAAIAAAVLAVLLREALEAEALRAVLLTLHRQAGLLLLPLLAARLIARWRHGGPQAATAPLRWAERAAQAAHALLYLGMALVPLLGWALSDARGQHPLLLGLLPLPAFGPADPDLADTLEDRHLWAAVAGGAVLALHVAAALWHHWVLRDTVLRSMLPLRRSPSSAQGSP